MTTKLDLSWRMYSFHSSPSLPALLYQSLTLSLCFQPYPCSTYVATNEICLILPPFMSLPFLKTTTGFPLLPGYNLYSLAAKLVSSQSNSRFLSQFYLQTFPLHILYSRCIELFTISCFLKQKSPAFSWFNVISHIISLSLNSVFSYAFLAHV
jgi:hypothetical protein